MPERFEKPENIQRCAQRLCELGYLPVPIPLGSKGPTIEGWTDLHLTAEQVPDYFTENGMLVGVLHKNVLALDIDVYDAELSRQIVTEAIRRFPHALERIGEAPKSAIFLRMEEPGFKVRGTRKYERGGLTAQLDVRSVTRQIVAYGKHPATGRPYTWPRGELWATPRESLPEAKLEDITQFRDWADNLIQKWAGVADPKIIDLGLYSPRQTLATDEKMDPPAFVAALRHIPSNLAYDEWLSCLMGIHDFFAGSIEGLNVAKDWSSDYPHYSPHEVEAKWRSFEAGKGVSYRSVLHMAKQNGADLRREKPRPTPNFDFASGPEEADDDWGASASEEKKPRAWQLQSAAAFTADFVAPEYVLDGIVQRGRVYTLTAPTGSGKTAVMLYAAMAIATGIDFCGLEIEHGDVIFMAGENPDDVRARVIATMEFFGIDPSKCRLHFIAGTFSIRKDMEQLRAVAAALPDLTMVVVDTFAAYFDGDDENSNAQALDFARVVRKLSELPSKPAVVMPAHPVKNATKQNLTPKGGSSLLNEVDGNLTLWNEESIVTFHWQGKHRGPEFEPVRLELQRYECAAIHDKNGRVMPTIMAKPLMELRAQQIIRDTLSREDRLLLNIAKHPAQSVSDRCVEIGLIGAGGAMKASMNRLLNRLVRQKMIKRFRTNWELTADGKKAVEMIQSGQGFAEDEA
ncbi:AAA family ATPase [Amaricoccus sp. W119]|uniref:AAA family ATPase n=1 Tax=Amaricoccus sp. W119 TaxID=3391833 RepID=UPI0039A41F09